MPFALDAGSLAKLKGVHPDLVRVVKRAAMLTDKPFKVLEGVRSIERQRQLVKRGASQTMNSRHIPAPNGWGHAVDIAPLNPQGEVSWSWPLYYPLAKTVKTAATFEKVSIEWGGDWTKFKDGPHWQLPWKKYPGSDIAVAEEKPITNKTVAQKKVEDTAAAASGGVVASGSISAGPIVDAISGQTDALSSGDYVKIGIAVFIVLVTVGFIIYRWRASE